MTLLGSCLAGKLRLVRADAFLVFVFLKDTLLDKFHQVVDNWRLRNLAQLFRPWQMKLESGLKLSLSKFHGGKLPAARAKQASGWLGK